MNGASYHEEEILGKAYDARLMRRLLTYLRPYRGTVAFGVVAIIVGALLELSIPWLSKIAIDEYISKGDLPGLWGIVAVACGAIVAMLAIQFAQHYAVQMMGQRIMYDMRRQIFSHLMRLSLRFYDRNPVGRLMTRVTTDVDALNEMFTSGVVAIFGDVVALVGIIAILFLMNSKLALATLVAVPLLVVTTAMFRRVVRRAYRDIRVRIARINAFLQENLSGMSVVQLFNREARNAEEFDRINALHRDSQIETVMAYSVFFPVVGFIGSLATAIVIWVGGGQIISGAMTFGTLFAYLQYVERFYRPIQDLAEKYNILQGAMASSERTFKLLDTEPDVPEPANPIALSRVEGRIEFRNVWHAYNGEEWVLRDVSFTVEPGQRIAVVGATGAGKTSLISLLLRFYEFQRGDVLVDGASIRDLDVRAYRRDVGLVLQDVFLFSGALSDNISLGDPAIDRGRIERAGEAVNADRFVRGLKGGYDHELFERGATLSVGQRQLISFARALAFDPRILILDEATSSVDTETEVLIQEALETLMRGRTSVVIAHRLSTIKSADRILVFHRGKLREEGTHQELLEKRGYYYRLYLLQYQEQEAAAAVS